MGKSVSTEPSVADEAPQLARRSIHRHSTIRSGRTIGEKREHLETANERAAARKKDKKKAHRRVFFTILGFAALGGVLIFLGFNFVNQNRLGSVNLVIESEPEYRPTLEIVDEDASATSGKITSRMETYLGQVEHELRSLGYTPIKAVIPTGAIRTVHIYLDGYTGYVKTTIDRGAAVSAEDADRLIRYLAAQGTTDFEYLDVRLEGKAYWK